MCEMWNIKIQVCVFFQWFVCINLNVKNYNRIFFFEGCVFGIEIYLYNLVMVVFYLCWEDKLKEVIFYY